MRYPLSWLKEYVDIRLSPEALAERLTMAGFEVTRLEREGSEVVFEVEVTPNRADVLSMIGLAREIAAITQAKLKLPRFTSHDSRVTKRAPQGITPLRVTIKDRRGCRRYIGRVFASVHVGPSPQWMADRLALAGVRSINNVVDVTNYVLLEMGQPLHAFDADRLDGDQIIVRRARQGETLMTIDGAPRALSPEILVIADRQAPCALAGIMGGQASEVSPTTTRVILESAAFDPAIVRRGSRAVGLASESSYRFERGVDVDGVAVASNRAAGLFIEVCGAQEIGVPRDVGQRSAARSAISVDASLVSHRLGVPMTVAEVARRLAQVGCRVRRAGKRITVRPPQHRRDLHGPEDLIEDIARLMGYRLIPETVPAIAVPAVALPSAAAGDRARQTVRQLRLALTGLGFDEVITYALGDPELHQWFGSSKTTVRLRNPLSSEFSLLRQSLVPGLLRAVQHNLNWRAQTVRLFELGAVYQQEELRPVERPRLGLAMSGLRHAHWQSPHPPIDFFDLKGALEALFTRFGIAEYEFRQAPSPFLEPGMQVDIRLQGVPAGTCGQLAHQFDVRQPVFVAEVDVAVLVDQAKPLPAFQDLVRFPPILRDLAVAIKQDVPAGAVISLIQGLGDRRIHEVKLFDYYTGAQIPAGHKGFAYTIEFRDPNRTLTDEEVNTVMDQIRALLTARLAAQLR